jgi:hypothetical protein
MSGTTILSGGYPPSRGPGDSDGTINDLVLPTLSPHVNFSRSRIMINPASSSESSLDGFASESTIVASHPARSDCEKGQQSHCGNEPLAITHGTPEIRNSTAISVHPAAALPITPNNIIGIVVITGAVLFLVVFFTTIATRTFHQRFHQKRILPDESNNVVLADMGIKNPTFLELQDKGHKVVITFSDDLP